MRRAVRALVLFVISLAGALLITGLGEPMPVETPDVNNAFADRIERVTAADRSARLATRAADQDQEFFTLVDKRHAQHRRMLERKEERRLARIAAEEAAAAEAAERARLAEEAAAVAAAEEEESQVVASADSAPSGSVWSALAECESGGDWGANTGNGYYGGLQFSLTSWQDVGGSGYPHENSAGEQIARAEILQSKYGWSSGWPKCSRELGLVD